MEFNDNTIGNFKLLMKYNKYFNQIKSRERKIFELKCEKEKIIEFIMCEELKKYLFCEFLLKYSICHDHIEISCRIQHLELRIRMSQYIHRNYIHCNCGNYHNPVMYSIFPNNGNKVEYHFKECDIESVNKVNAFFSEFNDVFIKNYKIWARLPNNYGYYDKNK